MKCKGAEPKLLQTFPAEVLTVSKRENSTLDLRNSTSSSEIFGVTLRSTRQQGLLNSTHGVAPVDERRGIRTQVNSRQGLNLNAQ